MIRRLFLPAALLVLAVAGCTGKAEDPSLDNPFDPGNPSALPAPDSVSVTVGDNQVRLAWLPPDSTADEYAVFRRRIDIDGESEVLLKRTTARSYADLQARNGRAYEYSISAGAGGRFGVHSDPVEARPGVFAIVIAGDAPTVRDPSVAVTLSAPNTVTAFQISEDPAFTGAPWRTPTGSVTWILSPGDGTKTVYGRYRLLDGSTSVSVEDLIVLDTRAAIQSVDFTGDAVRAPGDILHFRLDGGEPGGKASVDVAGLFDTVTCYDDGSNGDAAAGDGVYERDVIAPAGKTVQDAVVTGRFTDAAGNVANPQAGARTLSVLEAPEAVSMTAAVPSLPPDPAEVTLRWTQSIDPNFAAYRVVRSGGAPLGSPDVLVGEVTAKGTLTLDDRKVEEGQGYTYRVVVRATTGLETASLPMSVFVPNVRPPAAVTLRDPDAVSTDRVALGWSKNADLDFAHYRVYRNTTGAVTSDDTMVAEIDDPEQTYLDDAGLTENSAYYYRVYVVDTAGFTTRSNEVEARTVNVPPPAVTLDPAAALTSTGATLSWSGSGAHDFKFYRLYRDTVPTVSTASTLVVEIDDPAVVSFRDENLDSGTRYYYRVFVVDDGVDPGPLSTGSNTISADTP